MVAAPFGHGDALFAERAFFRFVRRDSQMEESLDFIFRYAEFGLAAAAVDEEADTDDDAAGFLDDIDDFLDGTASRDDIFDDEDAFTRFDVEATAKSHDALFTFREDSPRAESLADFMSQQDAAGHRTHDGLDVLVLETFCQFFAELFRIFRMLENVELFNVQRAVQARRQQEMTFENGFRFY